MTLNRRIARLEAGALGAVRDYPKSIVFEAWNPSEVGPELGALILWPLGDGTRLEVERRPGESEAELRARFEAACDR